jgi:sulfonate transport system substrate-binding protein
MIGLAAMASVSILIATGSHALAQEKVVRVGHQTLSAYTLLKQQGILEQRLKPLGYSITWAQFPGGPQLLDGIKMSAVDIAHAGETPPVFAQADRTPLVYVGHEPASPKTEAIIVPKDSPLKAVNDLKGKKVALNRGSNVHYLLVRALEKAGLKYSDVEPVFLPPAGGREAFEKGSIDAWVIWEPYRAAAEMSLGARTWSMAPTSYQTTNSSLPPNLSQLRIRKSSTWCSVRHESSMPTWLRTVREPPECLAQRLVSRFRCWKPHSPAGASGCCP